MTAIALTPEVLADYEALAQGAALADCSARTRIELAGDDRSRFLHNLCTNEIRKLAPGAGCEMFLTNVQGKTIGHAIVFSGPDSLVLNTVPGVATTLLAHFDRYLIRERVELRDRSSDWAEWLLSGPKAESLLSGLAGVALPAELWSSLQARIADREVWLRRVDIAGPSGFLIDTLTADHAAIGAALVAAGARRCGVEAFEAARIEAGFPQFGLDLSDQNLPQELARDGRAISFVKGCYLGQETVARIDALGHVNKTLVGIRVDGRAIPAAGMGLTADGAAVGQVTSAAWSVRLDAPVALAYVRRGHNQPGTRLESELGPVEVLALPLVRP